MTANQTSADGAVVTYPTPTATDDSGNPAAVSCAPVSGSTFPPGRTTVACTATPRYGATATASFTVTVRETFCNGVPATILAMPGEPAVGTGGPDVIVGTDFPDEIRGGGGRDLICGMGGD